MTVIRKYLYLWCLSFKLCIFEHKLSSKFINRNNICTQKHGNRSRRERIGDEEIKGWFGWRSDNLDVKRTHSVEDLRGGDEKSDALWFRGRPGMITEIWLWAETWYEIWLTYGPQLSSPQVHLLVPKELSRETRWRGHTSGRARQKLAPRRDSDNYVHSSQIPHFPREEIRRTQGLISQRAGKIGIEVINDNPKTWCA